MRDWTISLKLYRCFSSTNRYSPSGIAAFACGAAVTGATFALLPVGDAIVSLPLLWGLTFLAAIDMRTHTLPDAITLPLLILGVLVSALGFGPPMIHSVSGAIAGYASLALIAFSYRRMRGRDGLGLGDAKLLAALGAWAGVAVLPQILLIAALLGLGFAAVCAIRMRLRVNDAMPFGPFLAISGYCAFVSTRSPMIVTNLFSMFTQAS